MGILSNMAKKKAKQKVKKHLKKGVFKVLGIIGFPVLITSLIFVSFVTIASSSLQRSAAVFSLSENQENPEKENLGESNNLPSGKVNYVGVDDTDTPFSRDILREINRYSNSHNPYYNGYMGYCERFCRHTYERAGKKYSGACCAHTHGVRYANKNGKIPKGAVIFSGRKPDGTYYQNGHSRSAYCNVCHNYAGHVAIYCGGGVVCGSQIPYVMTLEKWIQVYGYGGWSLH